jgi:thymidylate synthase
MSKPTSQEDEYLQLLRDIINYGYDKPSRNGGTRFLVNKQLTFELSRPNETMIMPLLTTKRIPFHLVVTELLWFLKASCNSALLAEQGNHIWDGNSTREYLDSIGLKDYKVGQLGPIYGWQWRRFNAPYPLDDTEERGGADQIAAVIDGLKKDPWGRRHIVSAWNPAQISQMALPPCHMLFQFIVRPRRLPSTYYNIDDPKKRFLASINESQPKPYWLDCIMIQRSGDVPLGVPFNIASYALLTHMIASLTGLTAGRLTLQINDAHIYHNQIDGCLTQINRSPTSFPTLQLKQRSSIDEFTIQDFELIDYNPQSTIKFPLSV